MKTNKARGTSFINDTILKELVGLDGCDCLALVLNRCRETGLPKHWNCQQIVSIYKGKQQPRTSPAAYRGLAIME